MGEGFQCNIGLPLLIPAISVIWWLGSRVYKARKARRSPGAGSNIQRETNADTTQGAAWAESPPAGEAAALSPVPIVKAGIDQRWKASGVDAIVLGAASSLLLGLITQTTPSWWDWSVYAVMAIVYAIYHLWPYSTTGQTLGKKMVGIRVVSLDGSRLNWRKAVVRTAGYAISALPLGLGYLWALWDKDGQTWHDKLAGTVVVPASVTPEQLRAAIKPEEAGRRQPRWLIAVGALFGVLIVSGAALCSAVLPPLSRYESQMAQLQDEHSAALSQALADRLNSDASVSDASLGFDSLDIGSDGTPGQVWLVIEITYTGTCRAGAADPCDVLADELARIVFDNYSRVDELTGIEIAITRNHFNSDLVEFSDTVDKTLTIEEWRTELGMGNISPGGWPGSPMTAECDCPERSLHP